MQQFTVPQFIDVESKIIGPITVRQFIIFLGFGVFIALFYKIFDFALFLTTSIPSVILAVMFAFAKINGRPLHLFLISMIQTWRRPGLRVWNNKVNQVETENKIYIFNEKIPTKEFYHRSRLAELSLIVDTAGEYQGSWEEEEDNIMEEGDHNFNL
ncbi:MAG: PrgI family protein [Patescibacteria group bacterium]